MKLINYKFSKLMNNLEHNQKTLKIILYIVPVWITIYIIGLFYYLDYNFLTL